MLIEALIVLPLLLALVLVTVQFGMAIIARQQVEAACREGARVAAQGGSRHDVEAAVRRILGSSGRLSAARVDATLTDGNGDPLPSGEPVRVTVLVPAGMVAPDMAPFLGFSLANQVIAAQVVMRKE
jgi:hypothetical protein